MALLNIKRNQNLLIATRLREMYKPSPLLMPFTSLSNEYLIILQPQYLSHL